MNSSYELTPVYDVRSSFYRKAYIEQYIDKKRYFHMDKKSYQLIIKVK